MNEIELPYIAISEDGSVTLTYANKDGGEETMPLPPQVRQILEGINEFIGIQNAEIESLKAERDGLGDQQSRGKWDAEMKSRDLRNDLAYVRRELRIAQDRIVQLTDEYETSHASRMHAERAVMDLERRLKHAKRADQ